MIVHLKNAAAPDKKICFLFRQSKQNCSVLYIPSLPAREAYSLHGRADQNHKDETQACVAISKKSKRQEKTSKQRLDKKSKEQKTLDCNRRQGLNCKD
eukprot:255713-Pelagomonas_calceolata.AAC.3